MRGVVFIGSGKIAYGKLAQALDHGALTLQIAGDFDDAMQRVREVAPKLGIYLVNSINPFRLEGQKTIMYRVLEALRWEVPDWIVVPGGNLGNVSAFGKAFIELADLGLIDRMPRLAVINAAGANTFFELFETRSLRWDGGSPNRFVIDDYYRLTGRAKAAGRDDGQRHRDQSAGEPAQGAAGAGTLRRRRAGASAIRTFSTPRPRSAPAVSAANRRRQPASPGAKVLAAEGVIGADERVVCILTGHALKDPSATVNYHMGDDANREAKFANRPVPVANDPAAIVRAIEEHT